jgi:uncharacterized damage-inducible protein DinB
MKIQDILLLYEYNYWTNDLLLTHCEALTEVQFTEPHPYSFGSIQATMIHVLDAEWGWRLRMQNLPDAPELTTAELPTLAALRARWEQEKTDTYAWLHQLKDEDLDGVIRYPAGDEIRERVLWHCLYHVVNHGTQHRSEVAALLTGYGHSPGDIDFTLFLRKRPQLGQC